MKNLLLNAIGATIAILLLVLFILFLINSFTSWRFLNPTEVKESYSYAIKAVKDTENIKGSLSGNIFYTSGYIGEELYYYVVIKAGSGDTVKKIPASNTYITECDSQPRLVVYEEFYIKSGKKHPYRFEYTNGFYKLFIPIGSLTTDFEIDLE
jgi:hypothetical protein